MGNPMSADRTTLSALGHNSGDNGRLNCPGTRPHCDMPALRQMNNSSSRHLSLLPALIARISLTLSLLISLLLSTSLSRICLRVSPSLFILLAHSLDISRHQPFSLSFSLFIRSWIVFGPPSKIYERHFPSSPNKLYKENVTNNVIHIKTYNLLQYKRSHSINVYVTPVGLVI